MSDGRILDTSGTAKKRSTFYNNYMKLILVFA
jgi:hypothetical protein